jgi:hypothetical protein
MYVSGVRDFFLYMEGYVLKRLGLAVSISAGIFG